MSLSQLPPMQTQALQQGTLFRRTRRSPLPLPHHSRRSHLRPREIRWHEHSEDYHEAF